MSKQPDPCEGCGFWRKGCAYSQIMGRLRPCPPGKDCTVRDDPEAMEAARAFKADHRTFWGVGPAAPKRRNGGMPPC